MLPQLTRLPRTCPRCAGPLYRDHPEAFACLYCGEAVYVDGTRAHLAGPHDPPPEALQRRGRPRKPFVAA